MKFAFNFVCNWLALIVCSVFLPVYLLFNRDELKRCSKDNYILDFLVGSSRELWRHCFYKGKILNRINKK
jgi:hypothetical protein